MVIGSGNNNGNTDFDYLLTAQHANASSPVHFPNQTKYLYDSHINFIFILFGIWKKKKKATTIEVLLNLKQDGVVCQMSDVFIYVFKSHWK